MRKKTRLVFHFMIWLIIAPLISFAQIPSQIAAGLKAGDAQMVASHFNETIEMTILDKGNVCSQAQGEQILKEFFTRNKPSDFKITHQGGEGSVYAIGIMTTSNGNFRVYFLLKPKGNKPLISQFRIEKD